MSRAPSRDAAAAGFTLLELLVVLAIIGAVAVVAYPRVGGVPARAALEATAARMRTEIRAARSAAVRSNSEQAITIDTTQKLFWSSSDGVKRTIADGLDVSVSGSGVEVPQPGTGVIRFQGDGSACDAAILLESGSRSALIRIDWATGNPRIAWGP